MTLGKMLETTAQNLPRKCAIKFQGKKISFRELNELVNRAANGFLSFGIVKGDHVGILSENCPEYMISYFAIVKLGGIVIPINSFLTGNEIKYIANDCELKALVTSKKFLKTVQPVLPQIESLKHLVIVDESESSEHIPFTKLLDSRSSANIQSDIGEEDFAVFIYTSGTTGHPKGAMLTHKNLVANTQDSTQAIQINAKDKMLLFLPMFHSFTFTVCVLVPVFTGATIIMLGSVKSLKDIRNAILFDRITVFIGVPAVFSVLANKPIPKILKYISAIKFFISGSAPLPAPVIGQIEAKFGSPLCEGYGLSEASPVVSVNPRLGVRKVGSVGPAIPNVQVKIVDENLNERPIGETGELAVKGASVMQGYYHLPEETKKTLVDGWLLTGDIAKIDQDGYIYIVDRKKDMLLVRGINVYPREIEEVLYAHPKVMECAVIGIPDESKGEVPKAMIVVKDGETLTEKEVRDYCKASLAAYKIPKYIEFRPSLPKTSTGKIMKRSLRGE